MRRRAGLVAAALLSTALAGTGQQAAASSTPPPSPDEKTAAARALAAASANTNAIRGGKGQSFRVVDVIVDKNGKSHTRMTRTYKNLPVLGGDLVVHQTAQGKWDGASLTLKGAPAGRVQPRLSAAKATKAARTARHTASGTPSLVVDARGKKPVLAWQVTRTGKHADGTPSRLNVTINAKTGKVLRKVQQIKTTFAPGAAKSGKGVTKGTAKADAGEGNTLYAGTVPLETTKNGEKFELKDPSRGGNYTTDMNNGQAGNGTLFTDDDNKWGDGTEADRATAGADAQYGTAVTWDYFKTVHGRNGIKDDGAGSYNRVHYGNKYANAFWQDSCFCMTYGDGDGTQLGPLVSMDVAAHEMSHGVTAATGNMDYAGEPGGLNEATSDIFAATVEFKTANKEDVADYQVGEEIFKQQGTVLRHMDKPSKDGKSLDCWDANAGDVDVHYSSGIANHFFYLLSEGSGKKEINGVQYDSPTCDGSTVTGIGIGDAEKIWYGALSKEFTTTTKYADARTGTVKVAKELFGDDSAQAKAVSAAWTAVDVKGTDDTNPGTGAPDIDVNAVKTDLADLQQISDENGGSRSHGTPGYDKSVEYLKAKLDEAGFKTTLHEFTAGGKPGKNLIADLPGGDENDVLMAGGHLDSVSSGPGINDNGSGSASLLEVALAASKAKAKGKAKLKSKKHLRFAWWGAEELGLVGSTKYVESLDDTEKKKITSYLNFDMTGSPNAGYFVYDSAGAPDGSAAIEKSLTDFFTKKEIETEKTEIGGRSDHAAFARAGIPVGGTFAGAEGKMTAEQAEKWDGTAGEAYDKCYHQACDKTDNINEKALDANADAIAYAVWELAGVESRRK